MQSKYILHSMGHAAVVVLVEQRNPCKTTNNSITEKDKSITYLCCSCRTTHGHRYFQSTHMCQCFVRNANIFTNSTSVFSGPSRRRPGLSKWRAIIANRIGSRCHRGSCASMASPVGQAPELRGCRTAEESTRTSTGHSVVLHEASVLHLGCPCSVLARFRFEAGACGQ